jgi:hypothetical protein
VTAVGVRGLGIGYEYHDHDPSLSLIIPTRTWQLEFAADESLMMITVTVTAVPRNSHGYNLILFTEPVTVSVKFSSF